MNTIKQIGLYILLPVTFLVGLIYSLMTKLKAAKRETAVLKAEKELSDILDKKERAREKSVNALDKFERLYNEYVDRKRDKKRDDS